MALAPDPSDKLDAAADGAFGGKPVNRRAGYGDRLEMALKFARKGACLSAGEGQLIVEHYEERLAAVEAERDAAITEIGVMGRRVGAMQAILAALREPSDMIVDAVRDRVFALSRFDDILTALRTAVAAAEQEASHES